MFDPKLAECVPIAEVLPAVSADRIHLSSIRSRFLRPPRWQPETLRDIELLKGRATPAAVLLALVPRPEPTVVLTVRSAHLPVHAGQIAFPGGKIDSQDSHAVAAALREAHEEIGLPPTCVEVLGELPAFFTGTGFSVTPVVGLVPTEVVFRPNPGEVEQVFEVPLAFLLDPDNHRRQQLKFQGELRQWYAMPYVRDGQEFYIWGVTAGILRNFYHFLVA
jgi:8-oxo-dGTP pyrophosphatase MutT (NUDIX family)